MLIILISPKDDSNNYCNCWKIQFQLQALHRNFNEVNLLFSRHAAMRNFDKWREIKIMCWPLPFIKQHINSAVIKILLSCLVFQWCYYIYVQCSDASYRYYSADVICNNHSDPEMLGCTMSHHLKIINIIINYTSTYCNKHYCYWVFWYNKPYFLLTLCNLHSSCECIMSLTKPLHYFTAA